MEDKQGVTDTDSDYDLDFDSYHPIRTTETPPVMLLSPKLSKVHLNDLQVRFSVHKLSELFEAAHGTNIYPIEKWALTLQEKSIFAQLLSIELARGARKNIRLYGDKVTQSYEF